MLWTSSGWAWAKASSTRSNLPGDADQLADRLGGVSIVAEHSVKAKSFRLGQSKGIFIVGHFPTRR